ncbi:MAG: PTS sugar transporter subunit IIC [Tissierellia bacterium]|nr:PTS sugar transporter subunit IIC [Tissierellia bacterium]
MGTKLKEFLQKKDIEISVQRYFIEALGLMAYGLFASLLVGTILNTIGKQLNILFLSETIWPIAQQMTGAAIGVAVAYALKSPPLVLFASTITGTAGNALGGPAGAFCAALVGAEFGKMISKETKLDIVLTPAITILMGVFIASLVGPPIGGFMTATGEFIMYATTLRPFLMGIIVSVVVGAVLTLPISSAALCMMLGLSGIAAGAATAGCCAHMVGFAFLSFKENGWGGVAAQGLGTSMLQVPNLVRNPALWIPAVIVSAITGPMATVLFQMENSSIGAGMGTSGLVGIIETLNTMGSSTKVWAGILLLYIIIPMILTPTIGNIMRKVGWIKDGDLKLDLI